MKQIGALQFEIPPNAPYSFSGLNTEHPVLSIGDKLKLIGEYQETVGTCLIFEEEDASAAVHEETGPSEANPFAGKCIMYPNQSPSKQVKPVMSLQRILKFDWLPISTLMIHLNSLGIRCYIQCNQGPNDQYWNPYSTLACSPVKEGLLAC